MFFSPLYLSFLPNALTLEFLFDIIIYFELFLFDFWLGKWQPLSVTWFWTKFRTCFCWMDLRLFLFPVSAHPSTAQHNRTNTLPELSFPAWYLLEFFSSFLKINLLKTIDYSFVDVWMCWHVVDVFVYITGKTWELPVFCILHVLLGFCSYQYRLFLFFVEILDWLSVFG